MESDQAALFSQVHGPTGNGRSPRTRQSRSTSPNGKWEAFKHVKANQGAAGIDGQSVTEFEADLSNNLYKLWNRLSSGSYFPLPVRRVEIPKAKGGTRPLGIPTVADRVAQEVPPRFLQPHLESVFHADPMVTARPIGTPRRAHGASAVLALRLGARSGHQKLLRQH